MNRVVLPFPICLRGVMPNWVQGQLYLLTSAETVDPHVRYVDTHQLVGSLLSFFKNGGWFCVSFVKRSHRVSDDEQTIHK